MTSTDGATRGNVVSMIRMRPGLPTWHAISNGNWRATINADTGEANELFDLVTDANETTNRVGDLSVDDELNFLRDQLTSTLESA